MKISNWMAAALTAAAGLATPALAQDSVSQTPGLPGDAIDAYDLNLQSVRYAVDLVPFTTSAGTQFGIAPLIKASKGDPQFFNHLISAQALSRTMRLNVPFSGDAYATWSVAGAGINPTENSAPGFVTPTGASNQFGAAFSEFGGPNANIISALVNVDPDSPNTLYVTRFEAAQNGTAIGEEASTFGGVSVDSDGNVHFRADDFLTGGTLPAGATSIVGNNIFRIDSAARTGVVNLIDNTGGADASATTQLVAGSGAVHSVPAMLPTQLAGRPVYVGPKFDTFLNFESAPGVLTSTAAHRVGAFDHRGALGLSEAAIFGGSVATFGMYTKSNFANDPTDSISVWGVDANGAPTASLLLTPPLGVVSDPIDPYTLTSVTAEFEGYRSQTAFRGGVGHVAVGQDAQGRGLASGIMAVLGGQTDPSNVFPVARFTAAGAVEWSIAAWIDATTLGQWPAGKPIRDAGGAVIGELTTLFQVTGGSPFGPSLSAPAFDSAGNIWFLSPVQIFVGDDDDSLPFVGATTVPADADDIYTTGLIRGVYNADTFGYELEIVVRLGDTFTGANSNTPYTITFLGIADLDSLSSGTFFSGNVLESTWNGIDTTGLPNSDPRHTGGVLVNAEVTYTTDAGVEEDYSAVIFISPVAADVSPCPGDINNSGAVDGGDLLVLLNDFGNGPNGNGNPIGNPGADLNGDGVVNGTDLLILLNGFGPCPE